MYFSLEWENGYVVTLTQTWEDGSYKEKPLRKFQEQGDAMVFRDHDCRLLSEQDIRFLTKVYNPNVKFSRIGVNKFREIHETA